jgi:hypothetical protein
MIGIGLWIERAATSPLFSEEGAVHDRCLSAVQARLLEINWPAVHSVTGGSDVALDPSAIVVKKLPLERIYKRTDSPLPLPCIIITPQRASASPTAGVTDRDDYVRPCLVTMVMTDNAEPTLQLNLDVIALWQQKAERAFHNQRLPGVAEVLIASVEPAESVIPIAWGHNVLASAVLLKFTCREPRGLS